MNIPVVGLALRKAADVTADVARRSVGQLDANGNFLSDDVRERNGIVLIGKQIQFVAEQARNSLVPGQILQQEHVLTQRSVQRQQPVYLACSSRLPRSRPSRKCRNPAQKLLDDCWRLRRVRSRLEFY